MRTSGSLRLRLYLSRVYRRLGKCREFPFTIRVLKPDDFGTFNPHIVNHQLLPQQRQQPVTSAEAGGLEKVAGLGRHGNAIDAQVAPEAQARISDHEREAQSLAQLRLDAGLDPRRLHVQFTPKSATSPRIEAMARLMRIALETRFTAQKVAREPSKERQNHPAVMDEILVILNPTARSDRARHVRDKIRKMVRATKMHITTAAGDARSLAATAAAQGFRTVVAAGGDGTINEVVNGLAGSDVTLGILPVGTMNVFASELGVPVNLEQAWKVIENGHVRRIDLARANSHYFVQLAGVGLDAQVVQETSWNLKKTFGPLSYLISAAQIAARKPPRLSVEADGVSHEGSFVLVGNGRYYAALWLSLRMP